MINKNPQNKTKVLIGNNQLMITVNPFDNFFKFTIFKNDNDEVVKYNLNDFTELKMTVKGPKKDLDFKIFRESSENDFENGVVVFKIPEGQYRELKDLSSKTNVFYINALDVFGNREIIYTGFFSMWDSKQNVTKLENQFTQNNRASNSLRFQSRGNLNKQNEVNQAINSGTNKNTTTNTSEVDRAKLEKNKITDLSNFRPRYRASDYAISIALFPNNNEKQSYRELKPTDLGRLDAAVASNSNFGYTNAQGAGFQNRTIFINYIEAYFKGLDIYPNETVLGVWNQNSTLRNDLRNYLQQKKFEKTQVIAGEFQPLTPQQKAYFDQRNLPLFVKPKPGVSGQSAQAISVSGQSVQNISTSQSSSNNTKVRGFVTQGSNVPIANAKVTISSITGKFTETVVYTTNDGKFDAGAISRFTVNNANATEILIRVTKQGFDDAGGRKFTLNNIKQIYSQGTSPLGIILIVTQNNQSSQNSGQSITGVKTNVIGVVKDNDTDKPITGAQVKITSPANIFSEKTVQTVGAGGTFDFGPIDSFQGDVKIRVLKSGYQTKEWDYTDKELMDELKTGGIRIKIINIS